MPSSSQAQHDLMSSWFNTISDDPPSRFLLARGWTEAGGLWQKPTPSYNPSIYEVACLRFLRDEWDYDWHEPLYPVEFEA